MFLPIGDTPNPPGRPYATWALIAVNIAVYLLVTLPATFGKVNLNDPLLYDYLHALGVRGQVTVQDVYQHVSAYDLLTFRYGFRPAQFSIVALFTSLFLHGGLMHLAGNMLFLYIFGDNVESRLGPFRYLLTYLGCGVAATLFFAVFAAGSQTPLIGASGAIFGVLGCYFLWFPRNRVRCFIFLFPFLVTSIYISARLVLGFFLVIDNILPFIINGNAGSGIAHGAHIGGFLGGIAIAWGADQFYRFARPSRRKTVADGLNPDFSSLRTVCPTVESGAYEAAAECLLGLSDRTERSQVASADILAIGQYLLDKGRFREALTVFRRFIADRPTDQMLDRAFLGAGKTMMTNPRYLTSAYHYFLAAKDLAQSEALAAEAQDCLRRIEGQRSKTA